MFSPNGIGIERLCDSSAAWAEGGFEALKILVYGIAAPAPEKSVYDCRYPGADAAVFTIMEMSCWWMNWYRTFALRRRGQ
jgi:hypothetical protein